MVAGRHTMMVAVMIVYIWWVFGLCFHTSASIWWCQCWCILCGFVCCVLLGIVGHRWRTNRIHTNQQDASLSADDERSSFRSSSLIYKSTSIDFDMEIDLWGSILFFRMHSIHWNTHQTNLKLSSLGKISPVTLITPADCWVSYTLYYPSPPFDDSICM